MTIRTIIYLPDPRLRLLSKPIEVFDGALSVLIDDMFETMYDARGVGLAAPQIGINIRLSVVDVSRDQSQKLVLINPEIIAEEGSVVYDEGCLSLPGAYDKVTRSEKVRIKAQERDGQWYEMDADGVLAECFQHEIDHLNGKMFIDLLSPLKRGLARKRHEKFKRQNNL